MKEEEFDTKEHYRKVLHSKLTCTNRECDICSTVE